MAKDLSLMIVAGPDRSAGRALAGPAGNPLGNYAQGCKGGGAKG